MKDIFLYKITECNLKRLYKYSILQKKKKGILYFLKIWVKSKCSQWQKKYFQTFSFPCWIFCALPYLDMNTKILTFLAFHDKLLSKFITASTTSKWKAETCNQLKERTISEHWKADVNYRNELENMIQLRMCCHTGIIHTGSTECRKSETETRGHF